MPTHVKAADETYILKCASKPHFAGSPEVRLVLRCQMLPNIQHENWSNCVEHGCIGPAACLVQCCAAMRMHAVV